jgi:hypothetical protein
MTSRGGLALMTSEGLHKWPEVRRKSGWERSTLCCCSPSSHARSRCLRSCARGCCRGGGPLRSDDRRPSASSRCGRLGVATSRGKMLGLRKRSMELSGRSMELHRKPMELHMRSMELSERWKERHRTPMILSGRSMVHHMRCLEPSERRLELHMRGLEPGTSSWKAAQRSSSRSQPQRAPAMG